MRKNGVLRVIDANLNRAIEGIRTIEDTVRFILEDGPSTLRLKEIRHRIKREIEALFGRGQALLAARESGRDVGFYSSVKDELKRSDPIEILEASFKRTEESLRVLEEFTKLFNPDSGIAFKKLRFEFYSLEKKILTSYLTSFKSKSANLRGLYVILDPSFCPQKTHLQIANEIIKGGAGIIQLREKRLTDRKLIGIAKDLREMTLRKGVKLIINDRADICLAVDADGIHLGRDDMDPVYARVLLGNEKIIGVSTHSLKEAIESARKPVDYISIGPIFHSNTKPDLEPVGLEVVSKIKKKIRIPLFAIGGINKGNIGKVKKAGADGVVVLSAVMTAQDIALATRKLNSSFRI